MNIMDQSSQITVIEAQDRLVPSLKQVSGALMPKVKLLAIGGEQSLHEHCQRHAFNLDGQMEMISHQTIGYHLRSRLPLKTPHYFKKGVAVNIVNENIPAIDAPRHRMVNRARIMNSWCSPHTDHTNDPIN